MIIRLRSFMRFLFLATTVLSVQTACSIFLKHNSNADAGVSFVHELVDPKPVPRDSINIAVPTFLGNDKRNYYGDSMSSHLDVIWKCFLGSGTTIVNAKKGVEEWAGAGWTGQPLIVKEKEKTWLIQGAFDHHLKRIDAATGDVEWNYTYDDILKGTGTIWVNKNATDPQNRIVIMQGSRKGVDVTMASPQANSYRAVSFFTGKELWRMNVKHTASYSRDVDASALLVGDTAYVGLENGIFVSFDPGRDPQFENDTVNRPVLYGMDTLYTHEDAVKHGGNLVTESSPVRIGDHIYITAGSGHVYGYDLLSKKIDWDFYIGSDMDGTPVATSDGCILVAVEKQYISGHGGIFKLDPRKDPSDCVCWYFPTGDLNFSSWEGGVIGSPAVNDAYNDGSAEHLAAFTGIDGMLNVVQYDRINKDSTALGPDGKTKYPVPVLRFQKHIGSSISTPIFTKDKLIAAGYSGIHLFSYDAAGIFTHLDFHGGIFEASPVADHGRVYIASRDGFLYCFGDSLNGVARPQKELVEEPVAVKAEVKKAVVKTVSSGKYHLIAGVFRQKSNADAFRREWSNKGLIAEVIQAGELYYVSIASASNMDELTSAASEVQMKFGGDCWIRLFD